MLRNDGEVTYYLCQHWQEPYGKVPGQWTESALEHFLFETLSYREAQGEVGDHYRELLDPQSASSDLWQKYGIHGFVVFRDAVNMLDALGERNPGRRFRIVRRTVSQKTEAVAFLWSERWSSD
jgi:hypothetical protein